MSILQMMMAGLMRPPAPASLTTSIDEVSGGILLSWDEVAGIDSYNVYYSVDGGVWQLAATGVTDTSYTFTPTEAGVYRFGVRSVQGSKVSAMTTTAASGLFTDVPDAEGIALMAFYAATDGDNWTDNTGWMTDPTVGNWYGVTVSGGHVTEIALPNNNLVGDISDITLVELTGLILLDLNDNASLIDSGEYDATISGLRISAVDGTAFLDNCAAITGYTDGEHLVRIYDSSNRLLTGVLAVQGSGETLSANLCQRDGTFTTDNWLKTGSWEVSGGKGFANATGGGTYLYGSIYPTSPSYLNALIYEAFEISDYSLGSVRLYEGSSKWSSNLWASNGAKSVYHTKIETLANGGFIAIGETTTLKVDNFVLKQVLAPSTSGVTIANDTFTAKHANFTYNADSYRVQVKAL